MSDEAPTPHFPARFNLAHHLLDARVEEGRGGHIALRTPDGAFTYGELQTESCRLAHILAGAGVGKGDRVLIALADGVSFVAALFGALRLGAVVAMVNPEAPVDELGHALAYTQAKVAVVAGPLARRAKDAITGAIALSMCLVDGLDDGGFASLRACCTRAPAGFVASDTGPDDVAMWLFSSGSTGSPKAAIHRHRNFANHIECYAKRILGLGPDDMTLSVPKLYFAYATGMNLLFPFAVGATAILYPDHPTAQRLFDLVARYRPTILTTVPTMTAKMLAAAEITKPDFSSLRLAVTAGEAMPPEQYRRWQAMFGVELLDGIGSVEMFHIYISNRPGQVRPGSLGRLVPGYEARVVRPDGGDAVDGEIGTLWVRGGSAFIGYHDAAEQTAAGLRDDWVVSGDLFRRDAEDYFFYEGRADDMLKVSGIYVSPVEVENVILSHPGVAECAVVGQPDELGLIKPRAFVVAAAGHTADQTMFDELVALARARLAHYKVPRFWTASEALPRNARGKIVRRTLRQ